MGQGRLWVTSEGRVAAGANLGVCDARICALPDCGRPVPAPQSRGGYPHLYCSESCRKRAWELDNPRLKAVRPGKSRSQLVLERLRQGPCTALELQMAGGGTAATSRVREARKRGYVIECDRSGANPRYVLVSEPEGG